MSDHFDAIVVGAGHNGLVTAGYLARAGWRVLVLERRPIVGGACVTEELAPGFRVSTAAYLVSLLQDKVVRDLELPRYGYAVMPKDPAYFAPHPDGSHLFLYGDVERTCAEIARFSRRDAERYPDYEAFIGRTVAIFEPLLLRPPLTGAADLRSWLSVVEDASGSVTRSDAASFLRMLTISVRELLDDWFESDRLKVALATDGLIGANGGPSTPGTAYVLLHHVFGRVGGVTGAPGHNAAQAILRQRAGTPR